MRALRILFIIGLILTASGFASDILGEYLGPIDYKGYLVFDYPEGDNPINNIVFTIDSRIAGNLIIVNIPSPWSHNYGGGALSLTGGSLSPGGSIRVSVSLNHYFESGEYPVSSVGTTTAGEVSQAQGPLLVGDLVILNFLAMASNFRFPLAALAAALAVLEIFLNRRKQLTTTTIATSPTVAISTKPGDCLDLIDNCKKARAAADAAEAEAQSAKQKADSANQDNDKAQKDLQEAQKNFDEAQEKPTDDSEAWVEIDGRRITSMDLRLRSDESKALWDQYRNGEIDANSLEKAWEELGEHGALEELRKKDWDAKKEAAEKALEKAKEQAREAEEKAQKAKEQAESARKKSDEAKALADKACKEADDCLKALAKAPTKPTTVTEEDAPEEESDTTEKSEETRETTEETTETTETYETTTETYETTTEIYETTGTTRETTTLTTETTEEIERLLWERKKDTKFFGPRLGESGLKPKSLEEPLKESRPVAGASHSRNEYWSVPGGAWADFWGTSTPEKMDLKLNMDK
jgi:hypothetical protein